MERRHRKAIEGLLGPTAHDYVVEFQTNAIDQWRETLDELAAQGLVDKLPGSKPSTVRFRVNAHGRQAYASHCTSTPDPKVK